MTQEPLQPSQRAREAAKAFFQSDADPLMIELLAGAFARFERSVLSELDPQPEIVGSPLAKIVAYNHAHEDAVEMGYPSITEALEHLDQLKTERAEHDNRVKELEAALRPFAAIQDAPDRPDDESVMIVRHMRADEHQARVERGAPALGEGAQMIHSFDGVKLGDFRRARAALSDALKQGEG